MKEKEIQSENLLNKWIIPIISVLLVTAYMPIFLYATNSNEVNFSEVILPLGLFLVIAIVIFICSILFTKSLTKASLISSLFILYLENYHYFEKGIQYFIPSAKYWHVFPIGIFLLLHICYLICVVLKEETRKMIVNVIGLAMGVLILVNLIGTIPNVISKINVTQKENKNELLINTDENLSNDGANIYYFLLDEAAPFNVIEDIYDSDMSEFREFLLENNFMISEESYNDSTDTKVVLTNLLNLEYIANGTMNSTKLKELRNDNMLSRVIENNGYKLYGVGDTSWLSIESLTENQQESAQTIDGKSFSQIVIDMTFLYPFFQMRALHQEKPEQHRGR